MIRKCPFCDVEPIVYELSCGWYVDCDSDDKCNINPKMQNGVHRKEDAIKQWNGLNTKTHSKVSK